MRPALTVHPRRRFVRSDRPAENRKPGRWRDVTLHRGLAVEVALRLGPKVKLTARPAYYLKAGPARPANSVLKTELIQAGASVGQSVQRQAEALSASEPGPKMKQPEQRRAPSRGSIDQRKIAVGPHNTKPANP